MNLSIEESIELFKKVEENRNYDKYRFMVDQIVRSGKVYESTYDYLKEKIENGELPPEDAFVLFVSNIRNTLKVLTNIEYLIASKLENKSI